MGISLIYLMRCTAYFENISYRKAEERDLLKLFVKGICIRSTKTHALFYRMKFLKNQFLQTFYRDYRTIICIDCT